MFTYYLLWLSVMFSLLLATRSSFPFCRHSGGGSGSGQQSVRPFARMRTTSNAASLAQATAMSGVSHYFALSGPALPCVSASLGPAFHFFILSFRSLSRLPLLVWRSLSPLSGCVVVRESECGPVVSAASISSSIDVLPYRSQYSNLSPTPHGYPLNGCLSLLLLVSVLRLLLIR